MVRLISTLGMVGLMALGVYAGGAMLLPSLIPVTQWGPTPVPTMVNHQGVVAVNGVRFSGTGQFRFAVLDRSSGLNLWTNDGTQLGASGAPTATVSLTVTDGIYNVRLGDTGLTHMTALPASLFANSNTALRIWFNDGTHGEYQLSPDHPLSSVPYALAAENGTPVGSVIATARSSAPAGWLVCDGSAVSRTTYSALFAAIGTTYGAGDESTTFNLPDLRGRSITGLGTHSDVAALGASDSIGVSSRTPTHAHNVPAHSHGKGDLQITASGSHGHDIWFSPTAGGNGTGLVYGTATGSNYVFTLASTHTHPNSAFTGSVGATSGSNGDSAFSSVGTAAPYCVLSYIIKH